MLHDQFLPQRLENGEVFNFWTIRIGIGEHHMKVEDVILVFHLVDKFSDFVAQFVPWSSLQIQGKVCRWIKFVWQKIIGVCVPWSDAHRGMDERAT